MLSKFTEFLNAGDDDLNMEESWEGTSQEYNYEEVEQTNDNRDIINMFKPVAKTNSDAIMYKIKKHELCVVDLNQLEDHEANYIINQLAGALYVLDGELKDAGNGIMICAPSNYVITNE